MIKERFRPQFLHALVLAAGVLLTGAAPVHGSEAAGSADVDRCPELCAGGPDECLRTCEAMRAQLSAELCTAHREQGGPDQKRSHEDVCFRLEFCDSPTAEVTNLVGGKHDQCYLCQYLVERLQGETRTGGNEASTHSCEHGA